MNTQTDTSKTEEQINLVDAVTNMLADAGHMRSRDWLRFLNPDAFNTTDMNIQRFLINRAIRLIVGDVDCENTMDVRYCLVDTGHIKDWLRLYKSEVIPCMVKLNLPKALH